ncbi:MAG: sugar-binding protein, partial [Armatimonadota bacterium]
GTELLGAPGGFALCDYAKQPEPVNLIPNGGFEEGAQGWSLGAGQTIDEDIAHSGRRSVRLSIPAGEPGRSNVGVTVAVKPNTRYRAELWIRRENVGVTGTYVSERDDAGNLTGTATQYGRAVPAVDGVWHQQVWDLRTQPATTQLNIRGDIYNSTGTIWLDDFALYELGEGDYRPIKGSGRAEGEAVRITGALPDANLQLEATLTGDEDCIRVEGLVRDSTGKDRAVGVRFSLPIDAEGWTWWGDAEDREAVAAGGVYRRTYECKAGIGVCSIYPWSALTGPDAGLSLALPLAQGPRVFVIEHDQRQPAMQLTFYAGLCADSGNHPSRFPFSFVIYRHDPAWGMRAAMERYYELFPESFVKRPPFEGYLNYANLERFDPATHELVISNVRLDDCSDFGEGYDFIYHCHGCYDFRMVPWDDPTLPSDEVVLGLLEEMVAAEQQQPRSYVPTAETIRKLCYSERGRISYIGDTRYWRPHEGYNHTDQAGWGLNFRVNEDPDVSAAVAEATRSRIEAYRAEAQRRPFEGTITADAIEGYHSLQREPNCRREHFATTLQPLTFTKDTLTVCMPNTIWDLHQKSWWPLSSEHQVAVYGNANGYEQMFTMPFIDVPMIENDWDVGNPGRFERFLRASAHHKIWRFWRVCAGGRNAGEGDPELVRKHFARGLAYVVYPAVYPLYERAGREYRALYRQYVPALEELSIAGWEPVPHARATGGAVAERFGAFADGELHLTLRNYAAEPVISTVALDRAALGIPDDAELVALDLLPGQAVTEPVGETWQVEVGADDARAFWIGTREQLSDRGFRLAGRTLGKIERLFASDLTAEARAMLADAQALAQRGRDASGAEACRIALELADAADTLREAIETQAPVDLAKLLLRLHAQLACVAAGELGVEMRAPRVVEAARGEMPDLSATIEGLEGAALRYLSPWPELSARMPLPADPARDLLPYVVEMAGERDGVEFFAAVPIDVVLSQPLSVEVAPTRVFRGEQRRVTLTVAGRWPAHVTLALSPPAGVEAEPAELGLRVGAEPVSADVVLRLAESVHLGELKIPWQTRSEDARYNLSGELHLGVSEPVPSVSIGRTGAAPKIDGDLTDTAWQREPDLPALNLLAAGKPATEATAVWLGYDDVAFYVAFRCHESQMNRLVAQHTERGAPLYQDDDVEVFIEAPGATAVRQFAVNALGTISDNFGNSAPWRAAAKQYDDRWTAEIAIPWSVLGVEHAPAPGDSWGMQFGRQQKAKSETTAWTPGHAFNAPEGFGLVVFK